MISEYGKNQEQGSVVLPILGVRGRAFDPGSFPNVLGRQWIDYFALKCLGITILVLNFLIKVAKFSFVFLRSLEVCRH